VRKEESRNETKNTSFNVSSKYSTVLPDTSCSLKFAARKAHYDFDKHTKRPSYIGNENGKAKQWLRDAIVESAQQKQIDCRPPTFYDYDINSVKNRSPVGKL